MGHKLDVYVTDSQNKPVKHVKVKILIPGFWNGGSLQEFTDDQGHAEFTTAANYQSFRKLWIYVKSDKFGPYSIEGGAYTVRLE